ncbi:hypothetical protein HDU98_002521 [Podochytrium sp. JEL0797]|nr:hypothetical protein HDU98_002521 [Podochytrium sp. JEL0797]
MNGTYVCPPRLSDTHILQIDDDTCDSAPFPIHTDICLAILTWVHPRKIQKFRRLSTTFNTHLQSKHFSVANLRRFTKPASGAGICDTPSELDKIWTAWPRVFQATYIEARLDRFDSIDWEGTDFAGPVSLVAACFGQLVHLTRLNLSRCGLMGHLPREVGALVCLVELRFNDNLFSGAIPGEMGDLVNLETLSVARNALSGPVPMEMGKLLQLQYLDLAENQLSGPLPAHLGSLICLRVLLLNCNQFTGPISSSLGALTRLTHLNLADNKLTGSIPREFNNLAALASIKLCGNNVHLLLPREIVAGTRVWTRLMENRLPNIVR